MNRLAFGLAAALVVSAGCVNLAPKTGPVASPAPAAWPAGPAYAAPAAPAGPAAADLGWRDFLADQRLRDVVDLALANNRDLRVAALNIERARALYNVRRADLFPSIDAGAAGTAQRTPGGVGVSPDAVTSHVYNLEVGFASYELDLFGRVRNLKDQALQQYFATEDARRAAQISLVAEASSRYLALGADRELLRLAKETLASRQASFELIKRRVDVGIASDLTLRQAETTVDTARGDVARFTTQVAQDENALALVVGAPVPAELLPGEDLFRTPATKDVSAGLPSEVLERRPDIMQAERTLRAADANIGVARAAFFPRIALTANAGVASADLSNLFKGGTGAWTFAPQATLPIFGAGRLKGNLAAAKAERGIALAQYERAIQGAFREVADALALRGTVDERIAAQEALVAATGASQRISEQRFRTGISSYLDVLDAQRTLYDAQKALISVRLAKADNNVTLYKVLGGGGTANTPAPKDAAPVGGAAEKRSDAAAMQAASPR